MKSENRCDFFLMNFKLHKYFYFDFSCFMVGFWWFFRFEFLETFGKTHMEFSFLPQRLPEM